jgi:hypothetical protein
VKGRPLSDAPWPPSTGQPTPPVHKQRLNRCAMIGCNTIPKRVLFKHLHTMTRNAIVLVGAEPAAVFSLRPAEGEPQ